MKKWTWLLSLALPLLLGCKTGPAIVIVTSTTLGFKVGQNPQTQAYNAELGYVRLETAYVPLTNTVEVPDVITEMMFEGLGQGGGFHQRLAVGKMACSQQASTLLFSRDAKGKLDQGLGNLFLHRVLTNQP